MRQKLKVSAAVPGALPARFRRPRLLIVGCGDVGTRVVRALSTEPADAGSPRLTVRALTSSPDRLPVLRALGTTPILGNLDEAATLRRLAGIATHVLHLAPPPTRTEATNDPRTRALLQALRRAPSPRALVYGSTTGVYGNQHGHWCDETTPLRATTPRALRRVDAERQLREFSRTGSLRGSILRIPGIYAPDREGGTPEARLKRGTPVLAAQDDVYTNHIHADDLARALIAALWRAAPGRVYNACDATEMKMGDYFDFAASLYGLPRPPRIARAEAEQQLSPLQMSFMSESRRLRNRRLQQELRLQLRYPTVAQGLAATAAIR